MADVNVKANVQRTSTLGKVRILVEQVVGSPSQAQINAAVASYIDSHPGSLSPLSQATKSALLDIAAHVAYIDANGQSRYDALDAALNAKALLSITAVYTQSGTVYDTDSLDSLKADLVVTAYYDDGTSADVTSASVLSGTLAEGTSVITATYGGKTTTFNVTVTAWPKYITNGLVHMWDGLNNTGRGHNSSVTVWKDLVGSIDLTQQAGGTWKDNALHFEPASSSDMLYWKDATQTNIYTQNMTVEVCIQPTGNTDYPESKSAIIASISASAINKSRRIMLSNGDKSIGGYTGGTNQFALTGFESLREVNHIAATYTALEGTANLYCNGVQTAMTAQHSFGDQLRNYVFVGAGQGESKYPYLGDIYCIRVYNRVLSASEIAENYAEDVKRFGLE